MILHNIYYKIAMINVKLVGKNVFAW